jgi:class 3 adenylate cyclase/DNA-binding CsgD family transcriptional regulator
LDTTMSSSDVKPTADARSIVATVMFVDIVKSTERAAALGDRAWSQLVQRYHAVVRDEFTQFGGREIDVAGDGFFAAFDAPARAVRCGCAISEAVRRLGLRVRVGLHTGECEVIGDKIGGLAVHIGARVGAAARGGEVLVSSTLKELVAGSTLRFEDHGEHTLRGVPGEWRLYTVDQRPLRVQAEDESVELIGRDSEIARIAALLDEAQSGGSGALVVRGEAGIGKSSLLRFAVEGAEDMIALRARGMESESELAFAALGDLFRPVVAHLNDLPEPQAAALAAALALGPPVAGDRFTVCAATLSLLAAVAEVAPVVAVVDDAQWLDPSSTEALLFAARRLDSEGVALLFGLRDDEGGPFDGGGLDELPLGGLELEDALELLSRLPKYEVAESVAKRLVHSTRGNPLALVEIPAVLNEQQLSGVEPIDDPLPAAPTVNRALLQQVGKLTEATQKALLVAAASETGGLDEITLALNALAIDPEALDAAEESGLISIAEDVLEFRHPLLRAAVYHAATAGARQAAHQALAESSAGKSTDRRAWHLAAATSTADEMVASALEEAALEARARGGHPEAAITLERAARLTSDKEERARRLFEAADDSRIAGRADRALELLDEALGETSEPLTRARIQHLRGAVEMWFGRPREAHRLLVEEAPKVSDVDPAKAARMLTDASWACVMAADIADGLRTAQQAQASAEDAGGITQIYAAAALGVALLLSGRAREARPLLERFQPLLERTAFDRMRQLSIPVQVLTWIEEYDLARQLITKTIDAARQQSALGALPYPLAGLSELDFRTGHWAAAYAGAAEGVRFGEETGQDTTHAFSLVCLARVEAAQGREEDCRKHIAQALEIAPHGIGGAAAQAVSVLGLLELGLGRSEDSIAILAPFGVRVRQHGLGEPAVIQWAPDLIEAYLRAGRNEEAEAELDIFEQQAEETGRIWALAAGSRCRGVLASEDEFEDHFVRAIELHRGTPTPFELARTELCFGEQLRRHRRRSDAREPLRSALEAFERLGAEPWAERARGELGASGETARRRDPSAAGQLTPQELQVALVVAQGATNREAGAALFLSPKTIEAHLGRIYRKLEVRSRTELARMLASEGALNVT